MAYTQYPPCSRIVKDMRFKFLCTQPYGARRRTLMKWKGLQKLNAKIRECIPKYTVMHHRVCCPKHGDDATITTRTRLRKRCRARHVEVQTCSLLPKQPATPGAKVVWVPDLPYQELHLREGEPSPRYTMKVPCRMDCLHIINEDIDLDHIRQGRCISGVFDCLELEREASRKTGADMRPIQSPLSYCA